MTRKWTAEQRAQQAEKIKQWQQWLLILAYITQQ